MRWFRVDKSRTAQPEGKYVQWKSIVREEGRQQCVYCAIGEASFGGSRNFHIDHYRPKKLFSELEHVIGNLFYSCAICNSFKGADWPGEPANDHSICAYPNPSEFDYSEIFFVSEAQIVGSDLNAGSYMVQRLYLNRPQLVMLRRRLRLMDDIKRLSNGLLGRLAGQQLDSEQRECVVRAIQAAMQLMHRVQNVAPYEPTDTTRP